MFSYGFGLKQPLMHYNALVSHTMVKVYSVQRGNITCICDCTLLSTLAAVSKKTCSFGLAAQRLRRTDALHEF